MDILQGIVKFQELGMGAWTLLTHDGASYELIGRDDLFRDGQPATVHGKIRKDLMSAGNMGPIFEVHATTFEQK